MKKIISGIYFSFVFILLIFPCSRPVYAAESYKRVLFISSYSYAWETVSLQIDGILGICLCIFYHNLSGNICPVVYHLPVFR